MMNPNPSCLVQTLSSPSKGSQRFGYSTGNNWAGTLLATIGRGRARHALALQCATLLGTLLATIGQYSTGNDRKMQGGVARDQYKPVGTSTAHSSTFGAVVRAAVAWPTLMRKHLLWFWHRWHFAKPLMQSRLRGSSATGSAVPRPTSLTARSYLKR